jgi:ABC-type sugar transport system ATPase subunit
VDAQIIAMDEPTAALTRDEVHNLFRLVGQLKRTGRALIFKPPPRWSAGVGGCDAVWDRLRHRGSQKSGLLLNCGLFKNHTLPALGRFVRGGRLPQDLEIDAFERQATELHIVARNPSQPAPALSGGNEQKPVLGEWRDRQPRILILDKPTRGVDVGAKVEIYGIVNRHAATGAAILMVSRSVRGASV